MKLASGKTKVWPNYLDGVKYCAKGYKLDDKEMYCVLECKSGYFKNEDGECEKDCPPKYILNDDNEC